MTQEYVECLEKNGNKYDILCQSWKSYKAVRALAELFQRRSSSYEYIHYTEFRNENAIES